MIDHALLELIQVALIEPRDGGASWPSGLWTALEVCDDCTERQNRLLKETQIVWTRTTLPCLAGEPRVALPVDWVRTVEVVYTGEDGTVSHLQRSDAFEADHLMPTWAYDRDTPQVYMEYDTPTLLLQIAPIPRVAGILTLDYVAGASAITGDGTTLTVPDLLAHAIKYGALADLLGKDGRGHDGGRAAYCEDRFRLAQDVTQILLKGWS